MSKTAMASPRRRIAPTLFWTEPLDCPIIESATIGLRYANGRITLPLILTDKASADHDKEIASGWKIWSAGTCHRFCNTKLAVPLSVGRDQSRPVGGSVV